MHVTYPLTSPLEASLNGTLPSLGKLRVVRPCLGSKIFQLKFNFFSKFMFGHFLNSTQLNSKIFNLTQKFYTHLIKFINKDYIYIFRVAGTPRVVAGPLIRIWR